MGNINFKFDRNTGKISWQYNNKCYDIYQKNLLYAEYFEQESAILILLGEMYVKTQMYAYDLYGNFKFEVIPPENYSIMCSKKVSLKGKGLVMGMACDTWLDTPYGSQYAIDPDTGELTYAGTMKF